MKRSIFGVRGLILGNGRVLPCALLGVACGTSPGDPEEPASVPEEVAASNAAGAGGTPSPPAEPPASTAADAAASAGPIAASCAAAAQDACTACVCERCDDELRACAATPGCSEILACVRESGCTGADCFCGAADPITCLSGGATGPCRDAILDAPGSQAPTALAPSAGPASDAAFEVGACAEDGDGCADRCALE